MSNWPIKKLGVICQIIMGQSPPSATYNEHGEGLPFYQGKKDFGEVYPVPNVWCSESIKIVERNDILISVRAPVGALNLAGEKSCIGRGLAGIRTGKLINYQYLYFFLQSRQMEIALWGTGSTFAAISKAHLVNIEIPLPPLEIQKKVVKKIEELFAKIAQAQSLQKSSVQDTKNLISSVINQIFIQSKTDHWSEMTLPEISDNFDSKRRPITKSQRKNGQYPYYGASGIVDQVADYIFDEDLLLISEDGANLLARSTPIAFSVSGKIWVNNHAHVLRFKNLETQKLVEYLMNNIDLKPYVSGSAQPKLNQTKMNSITIPLPPLAEQKKIVAQLDALTQKVRELQALQYQTASDLTALKQSILQQAFQGELVN